jgi:hypothetical protein
LTQLISTFIPESKSDIVFRFNFSKSFRKVKNYVRWMHWRRQTRQKRIVFVFVSVFSGRPGPPGIPGPPGKNGFPVINIHLKTTFTHLHSENGFWTGEINKNIKLLTTLCLWCVRNYLCWIWKQKLRFFDKRFLVWHFYSIEKDSLDF